jgi:cytoskeletal protein RodZ
MTRTDVMASSRPQAQGAARVSGGSSSGWRRLIVLPVMLLLAVALVAPMSAVAATTTTNKEGLSGYEKKPEEKSGTSPSKEKSTPETKEAAPTTTSATPSPSPSSSTSPTTEKAATLPFTGFDLRWTVGMGLLLVGAGFSIVTVQRRHRRGER